MKKRISKTKIKHNLGKIMSNKPLLFIVAVLLLAGLFSSPQIKQYFRATGSKAGGLDPTPIDVLMGPETQLTDLPAGFGVTDIFGDTIVGKLNSWGQGIYAYNLSSKILTNITEGADVFPSFDGPRIYGNTVIYKAYQSGLKINIFKYDILSKQTIPLLDSEQYSWIGPRLDVFANKVVFEARVNDENDDNNIFMLNISTNQIITICDNNKAQIFPRIYENIIVWTDSRNNGFLDNNDDIYMFNLRDNKETQVTFDAHTQASPDIYKNKVVWSDWRNFDNNGGLQDQNVDIYMYDINTKIETPVATDTTREDNQMIWGDYIVYRHLQSVWAAESDIFLYRISTGKKYKISGGNWIERGPLIRQLSSKSIDVIWNDERNSSTPSVYMRRVNFLF